MSGAITAIVSAVVVGGATIYAANKSASATEDAANKAIAGQEGALAQQAALSQPYRDIATGGAIDQYKKLLGIGPGGAGDIQKTLEQTPGYQFTKQQGLDATKAQAAAMGLGLSGNTLTALDQYSSGLADQTYQQVLGNSLNAVQLGQAAAAGQAANIGNAANTISGILTNQGNTNAGIYANEAASLAKIAGNAGNQYITYNTLKNLNNAPSSTPNYGGGYVPPVDPGVNAPADTVISA